MHIHLDSCDPILPLQSLTDAPPVIRRSASARIGGGQSSCQASGGLLTSPTAFQHRNTRQVFSLSYRSPSASATASCGRTYSIADCMKATGTSLSIANTSREQILRVRNSQMLVS